MKNNNMKNKFLDYEKIRQSGRTNMFNINMVIALSDGILTAEDCYDIMKNYSKYKKKYYEKQ